MPGWWGRKSSHKTTSRLDSSQSQPPAAVQTLFVLDSPKSITQNSSPNSNSSKGRRSCEFRPRGGVEDGPGVGGGSSFRSTQGISKSSRFSGFDSESAGSGGWGRECHPLPRPLVSPPNAAHRLLDHAGGTSAAVVGLVVNGGGSASVSSVSSSGSVDDATPSPLLDQFPQPGVSRAKSPCTGSRGVTASTSPLHPRLAAGNFESPTGKSDDGRNQGHPLPLPPSSPTSPSAMHNNGRPGSYPDNTNNNVPSKWMKGRLLGRGTFGHVYLGFNSEKGRMCAIKEVTVVSDDLNSRESLKQLNQEINMLSQLSHPNIVQYHGSELFEETLSVYLEYVSGGSIHKLLQEYGPFKEPVIQNYTRQILSGLAYLHARKTVHRDIKGANILVDPHGEIKLADFGMAKHITNCTSVLSFKGSPYWMAPEVVMNINGYNLAVDIWSLGCTILEMATSKPPWSQFEGVAAIFKIGNSKDIPEIPDYLSNEAKSFLRLCFQRDPSARPSAAELLDHPFVMDPTTVRAPRLNLNAETFSSTSDGSHLLKPLDMHPRRKSLSTYGVDNVRRPVVPVSMELWDNARTIISLPVSPCSSPLRQTGPAYKSCFLSPPHPAYAWVGPTSQTPNDPSLSPTRAQSSSYLPDPWNDTQTIYRSQIPGGSPRTRMI